MFDKRFRTGMKQPELFNIFIVEWQIVFLPKKKQDA